MDPLTAKAIKKFPHKAKDIAQSFDEKQVKSKQWLYEELSNIPIPSPQRIYIAGSWYGNLLVPLIQKIYPSVDIRLHDIDEETVRISNNILFQNNENVKSKVVDANSFRYKYFLINTSAEHMKPLNTYLNTYVVLQSNNYRSVEDHTNCVDSAEELAKQYGLTEVYYSGNLEFEKYTRYMVIGKV